MQKVFSFSALTQIASKYGSFYLEGLGVTLRLSFIAVFFGSIFGTLLAIMRRSRFTPVRMLAVAYTEIIRNTPLLLQLYLFYFLLPEIAPLPFLKDKFICIAFALCCNSAAYVSEVIRAGIQAVDKGQSEAARTLGLNQQQTMTKIVLPQAIRNILPALCNEFVTIVKETSLGAVLFVGGLMSKANIVSGTTTRRIETLLIAGAFYFVINFGMSKLVAYLERRLQGGKQQ